MNSHVNMVLPPAPWTKALEDDSVIVPGLTWDAMTDISGAPERFVATHAEDVDVGENGLRRYIIDLLKGAPRLAIPAFFGREHMQRNLIVSADSNLTHPGDLAGKRIGSRLTVSSGTGAAVLMILEQAYGLSLKEMTFYMGNPDNLKNNKMGLQVKQGPATDEEGFQLLMKGELDAVVLTSGPRYFSMFGHDRLDEAVAANPGVRVLVNDPTTIAEAYRRSGLYPISDLVVLGKKAVAADPNVPAKVMAALSEANKRASHYRDEAEEKLARDEIALLGFDPHEYRLGPEQRKNIAAYTDFFYRMGAIDKYVEPEELFIV
ncbi:MAG: ABC transporter substrate-binding protein [Deltaproteobacteria bacterium]|nr:ABC transporter substrate-binding protein [Deltaproteobacteria bacterium]